MKCSSILPSHLVLSSQLTLRGRLKEHAGRMDRCAIPEVPHETEKGRICSKVRLPQKFPSDGEKSTLDDMGDAGLVDGLSVHVLRPLDAELVSSPRLLNVQLAHGRTSHLQ